jgi:2-dehydro-3-deoxy-D-arabinonate dehydratase
MIHIYRTTTGLYFHDGTGYYALPDATIDGLFTSTDPLASLAQRNAERLDSLPGQLLPPIGSQEIWAAGVTYLRSRDARKEESETSGANRFYDHVYAAPRPELFFKATPHRVRGSGALVGIRSDGTWNVPEPELTLAINDRGHIIGYTIGNDMSSRDIEGENPLYLPQAKVYRGSCALGPTLVLMAEPISAQTAIDLTILRAGIQVFHGQTTLAQMKRQLPELADWLFRENDFPHGAYLMTGTGIVPPTDFTLAPGDIIRITIEGLGTLENTVG